MALKRMLKLTFVLILSQVALVEFAYAREAALKTLCDGGSVKIKTITDLQNVVAELDTVQHNCDFRTRKALLELGRFATRIDVCTMDKAEAITKFVSDYIDGSEAGGAWELPKPLADFAIAYGMQVSGACSEHMIEVFAPYAKSVLEKQMGEMPFSKIERYFADENPVGLVLDPIVKAGEIVLPADLMQITPGMDTKFGAHLSDSTGLGELEQICKQSLQPLYEPILLPLAHLNRAGFDNRETYFRKSHRRDGHFWSTAVFLCEMVKMFKKNDHNSDGSSQRDQFTLGDLLKNSNSNQMAGPKMSQLDLKMDIDLAFPEAYPTVERYDFRQDIDDKVYCTSVRSLVKSFDANKDGPQRLQDRIQRRSFSVFVNLMKKGQYKPVLMDIVRSLKFQGNSNQEMEEARTAMIKMMEAPSGFADSYKYIKNVGTVLLAVSTSPIWIPYVIILDVIAHLSYHMLTVDIEPQIEKLKGKVLEASPI